MPSPRRCDPNVPTAAHPRSADPRASDAAAPPSPPPPVLTSSSELGDWIAASAASRGPTPPRTEGHRTPPASPQAGPSPSTPSGGEDPPTFDDDDDDDDDDEAVVPLREELTVTKSTSMKSVVRSPRGTVRTTKSGLLTRDTTALFGGQRQPVAVSRIDLPPTTLETPRAPTMETTRTIITLKKSRALPNGQGWQHVTRSTVGVVVSTPSFVVSSTTPLPTFSYTTDSNGVPLAESGVGVLFSPNRA